MARGPKGAVVTRSVSTVKKIRLELSAADIRRRFRLPDDAALTVRVPGGGDWSNTDLDIDTTCPLVVEWTETKEG